jgi:hypothetical protein
MKKEWKEWFINQTRVYPSSGFYDWEDRRYTYLNLFKGEVPFHEELKEYIFSKVGKKDTFYEVYHVHTWKVGDFFKEHKDNNFNRRWSYVCELQPSECDTTLLVEGNPLEEGVFDFNTKHEVPMIKKGVRISLTVFGSDKNTLI